MMNRISKLLFGILLGTYLLSGCAETKSNQLATGSRPQCQSKWVEAGNNGAKADRYVQPNCQQP